MADGPSLRVALVTTFYPPYNFGGDGIYVRRLAHSLRRLGCRVTVIHDKDAYRALAPKGQSEPEPLSEPDGIDVHGLASGWGVISPLLTQQLGTPVVNARAIRDILAQGFDVVHYHNVSLVGGPGILSMGPPALRLYTAHEHWLVCPTHILWRNNREICTGRKCLECQLTYRRPPQAWRSLGVLERHAGSVDAFIALSESSADNHRRFGFSRPMRVMPSFLPDLPASGASGEVPNSGRPYILFAGRLELIKGLQDVIPFFDNDMPADLLIAGNGDYEGALRDLARDRPRVKFLGRLAPEDLNSLYRHALALVTPSNCYEVFPLVALEAFRSGTPIIARNVGSYPEIVRDSKAGYLFNNPEDIRGIVARLIETPGLREGLSKQARSAFEANWSEAASLSAYFDLIAELAVKRNMPGVEALAQALARTVRLPAA